MRIGEYEVTTIYALIDPTTRQCRYVGKTGQKNPRARLRAHINRACADPGARHCASWISGLLRQGYEPEMMELEKVVSDWEEAERFWIANMRFLGADLTNMTVGGGGDNRSIPSDDVRAKISRAARLQFSTPEARIAAATFARDAWKKQSDAKKLKWKDPEYVRRVQEGQAKADHSSGALRMWERPEYREAQRLARERRYGKKEASRAD